MGSWSSGHLSVCVFTVAFVLVFCGAAASANERVLYSFRGGSDGSMPHSALIADSSGNMYGTTAGGGGSTACGSGGCGTVYKLAPDGTESILYAFEAGDDGAFPLAGLVADGAGNLYGTTAQGGASDQGTVFEIASDGTETQLYAFTGGTDGSDPVGALVMDSSGNLYGTTADGGDAGLGAVFEITSPGKESVLYSFHGGSDGLAPGAGVIRDSSGNLYGTTVAGGNVNNYCGSSGCGTVFRIASDGTETVLYSFQGGNDGFAPASALLMDSAGDLFGTTNGGGASDQGTVFKLASDGTETVLYAFKGGSDGNDPLAGLIIDKSGNLYGTTFLGGSSRCRINGFVVGCGTVFKLTPDGVEHVLFSFGKGGKHPAAGLLKGKKGVLYGTATAGGANHDGVIFSIAK